MKSRTRFFAALLALGVSTPACKTSTPAATTTLPQDTDSQSSETTRSSDTSRVPGQADVALVGGTVVGVGPRTVVFTGDTISAILEPSAPLPPVKSTVDVTGKWLVPSFVDSHVHALYRLATDDLAKGGLAAVVDHAAPVAIFETSFAITDTTVSLEVLAAGPMVTPVNGYPTQS